MNKWGLEFHLDLLQEEAGELITAINHYRRRRPNSFIGLLEEISDLELVLEAVKTTIIQGTDKYVYQGIKIKKVVRLKERLKEL